MHSEGLVHMRGTVYTARLRGEPTYQLPLVQRVGKSTTAQVLAICDGAEVLAWVEAHREQLRSGVSLVVRLEDIHAKGDQLVGFLRATPRIAPPRHATSAPESSTSEITA